jgi:uncharacterized protein (TIGR03435 family)
MHERNDITLLREFAANESEAAFAALVSRHLNLVYSVALRSVGNAHAAREISQAVFIILARKAKSLGPKTILSGWLYQTTRLTTANFLRTEIRRQQREQEAYMQSTLNEPDSNVWPQIAPLLDDALGKLGERDRNAIVLRFFENKNLREVGAAMGASEDAAKMRVSRALEKLRKIFGKRGVTLSAVLIAGAVSAGSVQAAPTGLAQTISAIAITKGAVAGGSTLALVKGVLKIMAWTKAKMAVVVGVGLLLAVGTATMVVKNAVHPKLPETDLSWADDPKYWATDSRVLESLPPVMIIRPTRFANAGGAVSTGLRYLGKNYSVEDLLLTAYGFDSMRTIVPENMPTNSYDFMYTLPDSYSTVLQHEIAKRFGYVAHKEIRQADVLLLKVQNPNPPNLKPTVNRLNDRMITDADKIVIENEDISSVCRQVEAMTRKPVLDRTGLKGNYDITVELKWNWLKPSREMLDRALLEQLGLILVPGREPIEMLVMEKAN